MGNQFRVSIGVDIDAARAKAGAGETRQAVESIGESAQKATPKVQAVSDALDGLHITGVEAVTSGIKSIGTSADATTTKIQRLINTSVGLHDGAANSNMRAWTGLLASEGLALDNLRAKYNPIFAVIQQYKAAQTEIRTANAMGALSADEMTAALARQRQQALATIAAIKGVPAGRSGGAGPAPFLVGNVAAQGQDVVVSALAGMPAGQIGLQQGTQLASALAMTDKPLQALLLGMGSLLSVTSLVTIGAVGLSAAAIQAFAAWRSGSETAEQALKRHVELIKEIKAEYQSAGKGLGDILSPTSGVLSVYAKENESVLRTKYAEASKDFARQFQPSSGIARVASSMNRNELSGAIDDYVASVKAGQPDIEKFRETISAIYLDPRTSQGARDQAVQLLKASESASELARSLPSAEKAISAADKAAERLANNLKLAQSGLSALGDFVPDQRTTTQRIEDAYAGAIGGAQSYMQVETLTRARAAALAEVQRQLDLTRQSDDLGTQAILARTAADRASIAAAQARVEALRQGGQSAAQIAEAERVARANVFAREAASSRSTLEQAQIASVAVGLTGLPATIAQINARYDLEIQKADKATEAIDNLRKARELEIQTATKSATLQPLQDTAQSASELERAVALQRATFGKSAGETASLSEQMRLYNEYARAGIQITPELGRAIAEAGARYGAAAGEMDKVTKAQQDAIGRMDSLRSATKSAIGAAMEGDWDSVGKAATNFASGLITDQLTQGLLGRQGEAGGGAFGDFFSGLLGGGARGASAANPVFVTFGAGAAGGLFGNLSPANNNGLGVVGGTTMLSRYREAIASIESSGRYGALGPVTASGDRAYGRYGVMGSNVGPWTQQALGYSMTPSEFLSSSTAQDAVFNKIFGGLLSKFGNADDAASAWFTGRPLAQGANATDILGTTGSAYVDKFNAALGMATTGLESFASSAKGASTSSATAGAGYPASLSLTAAQAAKMPAGVSPYGTGWAEQQVGALSASFSVLNQGVSSIVDQFIPGLGSVLGQLLNGISGAGGGSGGGGGFFSWLGSLFTGGSGWGVDNSAAFLPYALGGVPPARGLHSYANQIVSTPTVFAFAKGAGVMGEAGEKEGIFPLSRDNAGRLGVRASWAGGQGGQDSGTSIQINNFSGAQIQHETTRDSRGRRQEKFVISDAVGDAVSTPGGGADRAMRQKYGVRSGGIRR